jgi:DNA-binding protein YbaB
MKFKYLIIFCFLFELAPDSSSFASQPLATIKLKKKEKSGTVKTQKSQLKKDDVLEKEVVKVKLKEETVKAEPKEKTSQLDKYIHASLLNSPDIKERDANKSESESLLKESYLGILPFIVARAGTGTQYRDTKTTEGLSFGADDLSVDLHQNIFGEGKITDIKINKSILKSKTEELEQIKNLIALSTIEAYFNIVRYSKVAKIQR